MKTIHLCFLWHMHQPYYTDPVAGSASMPWVRLHAIKAYFDMAYLLQQFPNIHATFNFTPSLLVQLEEVASGSVHDLFLEYAHRPAADLSSTEKAFLIRHFFSANWATMVRPFPRYHELLVKRGADVRGQDLERIARQFTTQELLDLQVWHNLAWFGYGALRRYPQLEALRAKNRTFTEDDKQEILALQRVAVQEIIPMYRTLAQHGQIELTTTPFYHPILPLVMDTNFTRRARPDLPLPSRFHAPEDADAQLRRAVSFHTTTFGQPPAGLWPSEGSVCPELIPLVRNAGLKWLATDEGILVRSLESAHKPWNRHADLYRPYRVGLPESEVSIVFRDRDISDAFGFVYQKTTPDSAAEDVVRRLKSIAHDAPQDRVLIPIILDGENPWEHYHDGGERFLSLLYKEFGSGAMNAPGQLSFTTSTISAGLANVPPTTRLEHLHSGSWINQDYKIWIGHHEDNRAWDLLQHTRTRLVELSPNLSPDKARAAWEELYAAEGSDWFWWYGDDFDTDYKQEFDRLFRTHLRNVWTRAGATPPETLNQPLIEQRALQESDSVRPPVNRLAPTLDGFVTDFFEWRGAGSMNTHPPLGAMWKSEDIFTAIYFGCSLDHLFFRLDLDPTSQARQAGLMVEIHVLASATRAYKLAFSLASTGPASFTLYKGMLDGAYAEMGPYRSIARKNILELALPFKDLALETGQDLRVTIVVLEHRLEVARYPHHSSAAIIVPGLDFDAGMWRV
ncbi:MAG: glycoside hydrolase family 57 protein [Nitrospiraceae bacterium]